MAITPFTSEWEWQNINRGLDYTVVDSAPMKRNNWTLTRSRYSSAPYASELDTKDTSLTAYNGGEPETISGITSIYIDGYQFDTTQNWVSDSAIWVDSGYTSVGTSSKVYVQQSGTTNKPDSDKANLLGIFRTYYNYVGHPDYVATARYAWCVVESTINDAENGTFSADYTTYTNGIHGPEYFYQSYPPIYAQTPSIPEGETLSTAKGTFSGSSTPYGGSYPSVGTFLCTADVQQYGQRGVEWYEQVQTWSFKDAWRTA